MKSEVIETISVRFEAYHTEEEEDANRSGESSTMIEEEFSKA